MRAFQTLTAIAAPLPIANIDTDKILAGRFLKTISRKGLGKVLFSTLRKDPNFILNRDPWDRAGIIIALENFGCGSSREHAPWALLDFGIRCVIAPSMADIFYSNCFKNGILPITLDRSEIDALMVLANNPLTANITVNLVDQIILAADGRRRNFSIDRNRRDDLLHGVDDIARTLGHAAAIERWEQRRAVEQLWPNTINRDRLSAISTY